MASIDEHLERLERLRSQLLPLSGRVFASADDLASAAALQIRELEVGGPEVTLEPPMDLICQVTPVAVFEFSTTIEVNPAHLAGSGVTLLGPNKSSALKGIAYKKLDEAIAALAMCTYLAMPDEIHFFPTELLPTQPEHFESIVPSGSIRRAIVIAKEVNWPSIQTLSLQRVVDWVMDVPGWKDGIGRGRVGRGLAAFSHCLSADRGFGSAVGLLWAMVGLEALYCSSHEGLRSQLTERSQLILGPFVTHKKRFGQVYDYRSRFVHGDMDVPFAHRERRDDEDVWSFIWESDDAASLALAALIATLQVLIQQGSHDLAFQTSVVPNPRGA